VRDAELLRRRLVTTLGIEGCCELSQMPLNVARVEPWALGGEKRSKLADQRIDLPQAQGQLRVYQSLSFRIRILQTKI